MLSCTVNLYQKERNILIGLRNIMFVWRLSICCPFCTYIPQKISYTSDPYSQNSLKSKSDSALPVKDSCSLPRNPDLIKPVSTELPQ